MLNRVVLSLSLFGMILALHLWIQKERNFDQGCWGVGRPEVAASADTSGCRSPELARVSEFLGVSVASWGYGFYFFVAAMAFAKIVLPSRAASACHTASDVAVALAFPYTGYLVYYQAAVAKAFCPLCLVSAGLVTLLFAIHAFQYWRGGFVPIAEDRRAAEFAYATGMGFVVMGALAAVLIFVDRIGTRRLDEGADAKQFTAMVGQALPEFIDVARLIEMKPARFDSEMPPLKTEEWIANAPALGQPGKVSVVVFLDPNCPSCKGTFSMIRSLAERYRETAAFYVISRVLWDYSLLQTQALELAKPTGKYFELWALQLDRQKRGGLGLAEIEKLFAELNLDTTGLATRLADVRPAVLALRERAVSGGINATPTIYINGIAVANRSRDAASLSKLIEQAARGGPPANGSLEPRLDAKEHD